jgi:hypothetical protein
MAFLGTLLENTGIRPQDTRLLLEHRAQWNGQSASFFALREADEGKAMEKLRGMEAESAN